MNAQIETEQPNEAHISLSVLNGGLAKTRPRKDALWRVFTSQGTSHMAGTMRFLDKNGLVFFNKELYPAKWRLTDKGRSLLFTWSPDLAKAANVKLRGAALLRRPS